MEANCIMCSDSDVQQQESESIAHKDYQIKQWKSARILNNWQIKKDANINKGLNSRNDTALRSFSQKKHPYP